ncbi:MAG: hypothetical protein JSR46_10745 [Verrucomicrobia bacterium]|nr:hypothetical protein [Verrucomicrobiota bacterium]
MATCGFSGAVNAQGPERDYATVHEARERDSLAVEAFVKSKRGITLAEKGGNMMISGEVHMEWSHLRARNHHQRQRGSGTSHLHPPAGKHAPYATNEFGVEADLMFDYKADRTWAAIQLQMDNEAGIRSHDWKEGINDTKNYLWGSGTLDDLVLRKAYMGYNILELGTARLDVELGRRRFYDVFDSRVQFNSYFDGLMLKYAESFEGLFDFTAKTAAFVIDDTVNHFGYVGELGFLNIMDTGLDFKYSLIDWDTVATNRYGARHPRGAQFLNNQYTLAYNVSPDMLGVKTKLYGAYLNNAHAHRNRFFNHHNKGNAWYAGVKFGEVRKANDWAVDANYQWVQAQAVSECDASGIQRDNPRNISIYKRKSGGFANYKGFEIDTFYAVTDNLTLNVKFDRVHQESRAVGGKHRSWQFQVEAVYAF